MLTLLQVVFWGSVAGVVYVYLGYPVLIFVCSRCFGRRRQPAELADDRLPSLSLLIAAYNEEEVIGERIENALALDYPREKLEIVVASDGSSDRTAEIVRSFTERGVVLLDFQERRGKSMVLNDAMTRLHGDLVSLSDANTMMAPDAARRLVRWFGEPEVGAVCGWLDLRDAETGQNADGLYWRYENFLKRCEGRLEAVLGANGAIYAIRRELYRPIAADTLVDDLTIPLLAKLASNCRIIYDKEAVAFEETAPDIKAEFRRRARIGAGGYQALARLWPLLSPKYGWTAFAFLSHKLLRWCSPFFLLAALISNVLLANSVLYGSLLACQVLFYSAAAVGRLPHLGKWGRVLRLAALFTAVNVALLVGFVRWLRRPQSGTWVRTPRTA